mgnify:CR=1 FL=1
MNSVPEDPPKMTRAEALAELQTLKNQQWETLEKLVRKQISDQAANKINNKIGKRTNELRAILNQITD